MSELDKRKELSGPNVPDNAAPDLLKDRKRDAIKERLGHVTKPFGAHEAVLIGGVVSVFRDE